jgi:hypothetical protein
MRGRRGERARSQGRRPRIKSFHLWSLYLEMNTLGARARLFVGRRSHQSLAPHKHPSPAVANDLVISTLDENSGIAMLTMNRPPANSLSLEM